MHFEGLIIAKPDQINGYLAMSTSRSGSMAVSCTAACSLLNNQLTMRQMMETIAESVSGCSDRIRKKKSML